MLRVVVVLLLLALAPLTGRAAPVTVEFTGYVSFIVDDFGLLPTIEMGEAFSGSYRYEGDVPRTCNTGGVCIYAFAMQPEAGIEFTAGGLSRSFDNRMAPDTPLNIRIGDSATLDSYDVQWVREDPRIGAAETIDGVVISLVTEFGEFPDLLTSSDLVVPDLQDATRHRFLQYTARQIPITEVIVIDPVTGQARVEATGGETSRFMGSLTSLRIVPEPSVLPLLGAAFAALLAIRRTRAGAGP